MKSSGWIPEPTGSGMLLTGYCVREKDTAVSEMTHDCGRQRTPPKVWNQGRKEGYFLFFEKGKFNLEHFKFEHLRVP